MRRKKLVGLLMLAVISVDTCPCSAGTVHERLPTFLACHGEHGTSENREVPPLGAQTAPYLEIQLYLFRERNGIANQNLGVPAEPLPDYHHPHQQPDRTIRLEWKMNRFSSTSVAAISAIALISQVETTSPISPANGRVT
jgi:hypothetical protein